MSLVIFCLLFYSVDYVPVKGEIIWHLSLTTYKHMFLTILLFCSLIHLLFNIACQSPEASSQTPILESEVLRFYISSIVYWVISQTVSPL